MNEHDDALSAAFTRLLTQHCTPQTVRTIEADESLESSAALWQTLQQSGFIDALTPEVKGGAGLDLSSVYGVLESCGGHALPLPLGETMLARALLAAADRPFPRVPIALGVAQREGDMIACRLLPYARTARWVLLQIDGACALLPCAGASVSLLAPHACAGELRWPAAALAAQPSIAIDVSLLHAQACVLAAQIAGAMSGVFSLTLRYANERVQFGKPIGKFQAVQHQISVMAEHTAMARMAARIGCDSPTPLPDARRAAIAKAVTSETAAHAAALGHALHGAIGMTAEYDLQLHTRRLHEWRLCAGAESYWQREIGAELLAAHDVSFLDFARTCVAQVA